MNRNRWIKAMFVGVVICLLGLNSPPPAQAADGDARWCPLINTSYTDPSCQLFSTLQAAVDAAQAAHTPGKVFALGGVTFTEDVVADNLKGVQFVGGAGGGVTTISGSITISRSSLIIFINFTVTGGITLLNAKGPHQVVSNIGDVNVQGGKFTSATISDGVTSMTISDGLVIDSISGNVTLTKGTVSKAAGSGAIISTASGFAVAINQSQFTRNTFNGLMVVSGAGIALTDVSTTRNGANGAQLSTSGSGAVMVTTSKTKSNHFDKNGGDGLTAAVFGTGGVGVVDTTANKNGQTGAVLHANTGAIAVGAVNSKGSHFDSNSEYGLQADTHGTIVLIDVIAGRNVVGGAVANNSSGTAQIVVKTSRAKRNSFDRNTGFGVQLASSGPISVTDVSASRNGQFGAAFINIGSGTSIFLNSTTKARNTFDRNGQFGLVAQAGLNLTASDVSASRNGWYGTKLVVPYGAVILTTSLSKINNFDRNGQFGLDVLSATGETLTDVSANKNGEFGARLSNSGAGGVSVLTNRAKQNLFNDNGLYGLKSASASAMDIHNTTASKNGDASYAGFILMSGASINATLTCSTAKSNPGDGLYADLGIGTLYLNSSTFSGNGTDIFLATGIGPVYSTVSCPS